MAQTVIGIFDSATEAQQAIQQLVSNGFMRDQIDVSAQATTQQGGTSGQLEGDNSHSNFFKSLFDDHKEANTYSEVARRGRVVTVHASSSEQAQSAARILDQYGAVDVNERTGYYGNTADRSASNMEAGTSIPIIEEELQVGKRVVETGGVRLRSRIIERPVEEHLRLREEHVHLERHAVNRPVNEADLSNFKEATIELTEHAEVAIVNKEARVVEEVIISKKVEEQEQIITDSVRSTDVEVERLSASQAQQQLSDAHVGVGEDATFLDQSHQDWQNTLVRMEKVEDDYQVAEDDPDVRGWDVITNAGEKIGEVDELIVDTSAMKVRYLDVEIDNNLLDTDERHILIPIGSASLDRDKHHVKVTYLEKASLANYPAYNGASISRDYEHKIMSALSPTYQTGSISNDRFYEGEHFDADRFSGTKRL